MNQNLIGLLSNQKASNYNSFREIYSNIVHRNMAKALKQTLPKQ